MKTADDQGRNPSASAILAHQLRAGGSWGGKIDDSVLPQKYLVDYVRVYQKDGASLT